MSQLPLPIRLAAGLAAEALERAKTLPQDVTQWPMTAVSHVLQLSMRVQQRVTELAIKGDEALAALREPDEDPPWAVFDEDLPADGDAGATVSRFDARRAGEGDLDLADPAGADGVATGLNGHDAGDDWLGDVYDRAPRTAPVVPAPRRDLADRGPADDRDGSGGSGGDTGDQGDTGDGGATVEVPVVPGVGADLDRSDLDDAAASLDTAIDLVYSVDAADAPDYPATPDDGPAASADAIEDVAAHGSASAAGLSVVADPAGPTADPLGGGAADTGPDALPSYPELTLASVRARLRVLSTDDLRALLEYEVAHADRPEFVRMLTNRIATVTR